jgi:DNA-directed RNA polymerase subunit alpha
MEKIGLPKITEEKIVENCSKFTIEPLFPGYGPTIGNALRRVLLSSITGSAATSFKIDGINHEFSSIPHVKEDMIELMMNLKSIKFKSHVDEPVIIELSKKGPGDVTAADFKPNSNVDISNPTQHLMSLDNKADIRMEVTIEKDRGFRAANVATGEKKEIGQIAVDASFSPVERVSMEITDTRVGQITNYDKILLEVTTDCTILPKDALKEASSLLVDHYSAIIADDTFHPDLTEVKADKVEELEPEFGLESGSDDEFDGKTKIEDANFSPRTANALVNAGIKTMAGLKRLSALKLEEIKGLGKKGIDEINEVLSK